MEITLNLKKNKEGIVFLYSRLGENKADDYCIETKLKRLERFDELYLHNFIQTVVFKFHFYNFFERRRVKCSSYLQIK